MAVYIRLEKSNNVYTNLDMITGKAVLAIQRAEAFSAIVVKLECESRTKLAAPSQGRRGRDYEIELECHKLLYKTVQVFPTSNLLQSTTQGASFSLDPGQHEFPFQFKIPFNNACAPINSIRAVGQDFNQHIKRPLPPSLSGFPGEAEIRYYLKVTAQRAAFYKENFRTELNFKFLPTEPIRNPPNRRESYARRQHQFAPAAEIRQKTGMFNRPSQSNPGPPPTISIDGRLPDPAIVTCNETLPLRVLVRKLNETNEIVYLKTFQIVLIGYTKIKAHDLERVEKSSWVICSLANLQTPLGNSNTPANKDVELDSKMWSQKTLPNTVSPTFETCNLSRYYELEISLGLVYGTPGDIKPELTIQPLRMPLQLYSGIKPSADLVARTQNAVQANQRPSRPPAEPGNLSPFTATSPPGVPSPSTATPTRPLQSPLRPPGPEVDAGEFPDEPPPSYEDAIAEDLSPNDGPRREYEQGNPLAGVSTSGPSAEFAVGVDSKRNFNSP